MTPQIDLQYEIKYFHDLLAAEEMKVAFDEVLEDSEVADEAIYNYEFCQNIGKTYACTGASKFVVLSYDWDWVLKIPFLGESINYCEIEKNIYEKAIEAGLEKFFTPMYYVGTFQTKTFSVLPLYLSKKVETDIDYLDNVYSEIRAMCKDLLRSDYAGLNDARTNGERLFLKSNIREIGRAHV